jgi:hypothetical protein
MSGVFIQELMKFGIRARIGMDYEGIRCRKIKMLVSPDVFSSLRYEAMSIPAYKNELRNFDSSIEVHTGGLVFEIINEDSDKLIADKKNKCIDSTNEELITEFFVNGCDLAKLDPIMRELKVKFSDLAAHIVFRYAKSAERTVALRKLLESMDCVMRA